MISVVATGGCAGWVLRRRHEFEAFDADQKSLGLFNTEREALDTVLKHSEANLDAAAN